MANVARKLAAAEAAAARGAWNRVTELTAALAPTAREECVALAFLRARAALHAELPAAALDALDDLAGVEGPPDELVTREVLRGRALVALGRLADAAELLEGAAAAAPAEMQAEAQLVWADALLRAERRSEAEPILTDLLAHDPPGLTAARALALLADLELHSGHRPIAVRYLRDALSALGPDAPEPELRSSLEATLLAIALETLDLRLVHWVRAELRASGCTTVAPSARARFVHEQLSLGSLLLGEPECAWAIAADLREGAPAGVPAIAADLLVAQIAYAAGERFTPAQLLTLAVSDAEHVAWDAAGLAGRRVLLALVELAAATAALPGATALLNIYDALPALAGAAAAGPDARTILPLDEMARAALAGARGEREVQARTLERAIAQWRALGDELGELRAVLALAETTYDPDALARAEQLTSLVPRSWLRRRYASLAARARGPERLGTAERRVLQAICEGLSTAQIAKRFGRSKNTIRNQTQRVYQVMEVRTRSGLVAKCVSMGLIASAPQCVISADRAPVPRQEK